MAEDGPAVAVRLDRSTQLVWHSRQAVFPERGSDGDGHGDALETRNRFGVAHEIGTQFDVRLLDDGVRLRAREVLSYLNG